MRGKSQHTHTPLQHRDAWLSIKDRANDNQPKQIKLSFEVEDTFRKTAKTQQQRNKYSK